jgi:hypothetical protein
MPAFGSQRLRVLGAFCAAVAVLSLAATTVQAASPAVSCGSNKIRAVESGIRELGKCLNKLATFGDEGDFALCRDGADIALLADFGVAEAKAAADNYVCRGDAEALGLVGEAVEFLDWLDEAALAANSLPDKCVKKAANAAAKGAGKLLKCYRKAARRWDPEALTLCINKASNKFGRKWQLSKKGEDCVIVPRADAAQRLERIVRAIGDSLLIGDTFFDPPLDGAFTTDGVLTVTGGLFGASDPQSLTVNGISVLPLAADGTFTVGVPMDADAIINPVIVELVTVDGRTVTERATVVAGDGVNTGFLLDGEVAESSIAMRFSDAGLDQVEPIVASLAGGAFDIGGLLQSGNPVLDNECVVDSALGCLYNADVSISDVGFSGFALSLDAETGATVVSVAISDFYVAIELTVRDQVAVEFDCGLQITAANAQITASFSMEPDAASPSQVDVNQLGPPTIDLGGFESELVSGICNDPILGSIIQGIVGDSLEPLVTDGFRDNLGDPDGAGPLDSPIAAGIEEALGGIELAGPIGETIGVDLGATFADIVADEGGLTFDVDASISADEVVPGAPDFAGSFAVFDDFPSFGPGAPVSGDPYGLALALSSSAFNELLKAEVEKGLLSQLPNGSPLVIEIRPTIAPFVTGRPGPSGELMELMMGGLQIAVVAPEQDLRAVELIIDLAVGIDLTFGPDGIAFAIGIPDAEDIAVFVSDNEIGVAPATLESVIPTLLPLALPTLADAFAGIPLPSFLGLEVFPVEISRISGFLGIFLDLGLSPEADLITDVAVTDLSTGDFKTDGAGDVNEWRHRLQYGADGASISARLAGMLGADACCTTGDETADATAAYRVSFSVLSDEDWEVYIAHSILGAMSILDEKVALEDAGGDATVSTVTGNYTVDGGAPVDFSFTPSPSSVVHTLGGGEGDSDVEFSGSRGTLISGSGNADVVVNFSVNLHAFSNSNLTFPAAGGDEVAIRLGTSDAIENGFTAGQYPSGDGALAARDPREDGHMATILFSVTP